MSSHVYTLIPAFAVMTYFLGALALFVARAAAAGLPKDAEVESRSTSVLLGPFMRHYMMWVISPWERAIAAVGITPNMLTFGSLLVAVGSGVALALGHFALGGWLYLFAGILDILDGRIARRTNHVSKAGAFFDSVIDRYAELAVFMGLAYFYRGNAVLWIVLAAAMGSVLVSYTRARGESLGVDVKIGLMQRPERLFYLGIVTATAPIVNLALPLSVTAGAIQYWPVVAALVMLAISTNLTSIRRIRHTMAALDAREPDATTPASTPVPAVRAPSPSPSQNNIVPLRAARR